MPTAPTWHRAPVLFTRHHARRHKAGGDFFVGVSVAPANAVRSCLHTRADKALPPKPIEVELKTLLQARTGLTAIDLGCVKTPTPSPKLRHSNQGRGSRVTGGAGYIGSHVCKALSLRGYEPVTFDNLSTGHRELVKWGPLIERDLQDREALKSALAQYRPAAVLHFAASAYVGESVADPVKYYRNNVAGSLSLFKALLEARMDKIIFSSTCATYWVRLRWLAE